ncbi:MAG TPA: proprotein convertase P-domain-containing protein [Kofleriaceae bacterium]|nr:proprotein convertase P-domain-containing protein [Kofleriaceae bacterium]
MARETSPLSVALALIGAGAAGCAVDGGGGEGGATCTSSGKCDAPDSVRSQLEDLDDPVARWLLESPMTEEGVLQTDYLTAVEKVAEQMGCAIDSMRTFVLSDDLVAGVPFPRLISTVCSDDDTRASEFFIAASFADAGNPDDVDVTNLEMFAWDKTALRYRFYATLPIAGRDEVQVEVEVRRCTQCHLNSRSLDDDGMPMLPIMNELTRPWPHWNAEPDFPSHTFEVAEATRAAPNFAALTGGGRLASAALFEQIVRSAQSNRVVAARLRARRDPADVGQAMALLRPLFCDEQVSYATEDFASGVMPASAVITGGTRDMFLAVRPSDWPWQWLNADIVRFAGPAGEADRLAMVPVRGAADVEYEKRLVALKALTPQQALRIRALDWAMPVFSSIRCDLWKQARARLRASPPDLSGTPTNGALIAVLYGEIMKVDKASLLAGGADQVVAVQDAAGMEKLRAALAAGAVERGDCAADGFCLVDLVGFGNLLDARARAAEASGGREALKLDRERRLCVVQDDFPARPAFARAACGGDAGPASSKDVPGPESDAGSFAGANQEVRLIPDGGSSGVTSPITVDGTGGTAVERVIVRLAIAHGWRGDLRVELVAPSGERREVVAFDPGDRSDDVDGLFLVELEQPGAGDGTWQLTVIDSAGGEQGFLEGWSLGVRALAPSLDSPGSRTAPF